MKTLNRKLAVLLFTLILAVSSAFPALAAGNTTVAGASFATYTSIPSASPRWPERRSAFMTARRTA